MSGRDRSHLVFLGAGLLVIFIAAAPKILWLMREKGWLVGP
jgi:hypothetical protein